MATSPLVPFGVSLAAGVDDIGECIGELQARVAAEMEDHGFVQVTGLESMTAAQMVELMTAFGPEETMLDFSGTPRDTEQDGLAGAVSAAVPGHPRVRLLGNTTDLAGKPTALLANIGYEWHQDASSECYSCLHCKETPQYGAETLFASAATMFSRLSPEQQAFALEAEGVFSNQFTAGGPAAYDAAFGLRMNPTGTRLLRPAERRRESWKLGSSARPITFVDPMNGRTYLWAGAKNMEHLTGLDVEKSRDILQELLETALGVTAVGDLDDDLQTVTPTKFDEDVVMVKRWSPGELCVWDNRRVIHSTTPVQLYPAGGTPRVMWQIICPGDGRDFKDMLSVDNRQPPGLGQSTAKL